MPQAFGLGCTRAQGRNCLLRKAKPPKSSITKEKGKAFRELREDKEKMVLTADNRVAMVVMDRKEYMEKVEGLLVQPAYRTIHADLQIKAKLILTLKRIQRETNMGEVCIGPFTLPVALLPSSMGYQKSIKLVPPLGLLYLAGVLSLMAWQK